jgi:DNA-binding GntR family transcriptional regulator
MTASLRQIDTTPMHERVYDELRSALMRGTFVPGEKVTLRALAAQLGTSDIPIRSAITRLVAEGALNVIPSGTAQVPVVDRSTFCELMSLRALLEGRAASLATPNIDRFLIKRLRDLSLKLENAIVEQDIKAYLDLNQRLKHEIYQCCGSPILLSMIDMLWLRVGPLLRNLGLALPDIAPTNHHIAAIDAIEAGDADGAGQAIARDIDAGMHFILANSTFVGDAKVKKSAAVK